MADMHIGPIESTKKLSFDFHPVLSALHSMCIINTGLDNLGTWVEHTRSTMSADELLLVDNACTVTDLARNEPFAQWLEYFRTIAPQKIAQARAQQLVSAGRKYLAGESLPSRSEVMTDFNGFYDLAKRIKQSKHNDEMIADGDFDKQVRRNWEEIQNPGIWRDQLANLMEKLWIGGLADEMSTHEELYRSSIEAFRQHKFESDDRFEQLKQVVGRDEIPDIWADELRSIGEIVWMPSAHIGPYMSLFFVENDRAWVISRARIPEGTRSTSPQLDRGDLVVRLNALSDATRLSILTLAQEQGEITMQLVMDTLGLTQSSASRHVSQLAATGLLSVDAREKTKRFSVNGRRITQIATAIEQLGHGQ